MILRIFEALGISKVLKETKETIVAPIRKMYDFHGIHGSPGFLRSQNKH